MDLKDLSTKSETELHKILAEQREKLRDLRFKDSSRQLKNVREIRLIKKDIARILTLLNQNK
ncbi:MAG: 50S ribosomal protein L29 [Patescibacteria group bacterium]|jgi:large subunit ribosomal protein L29|nr:50S ribosomal protein L29 [Patescibacteria group bacterium]